MSCTSSISDETIKEQIKEYIENSRNRAKEWNVYIKFSDFFEIIEIKVEDKLIEDKRCRVSCTVKVRVKKKYPKNAFVTIAYDYIVGKDAGKVGAIKSGKTEFWFARWEKGWKLEI